MLPTRTVPTADLSKAERSAIRGLLDLAFAGDFDDHDFDHALGGLHVLVLDGGEPIAHASVVQRRFLHAGMSEGEVIARVGQPDVKTKTRRGVRWTYLPVAEDAGTMTTVSFERGAVAEIERKIIR